ncbi:MAG: hypothetical protein R2771_15685 [Saprospiraceae bacterium]
MINRSVDTIFVYGIDNETKNPCNVDSKYYDLFNGNYIKNPFYVNPSDSFGIGSYGWVTDSVYLYIFKKDTIDKYGYEKVCKDNLYEKEYRIRTKELKEHTIIYE